MIANGVEDTVAHKSGQELLNKQSQQDSTDSSQEEVVNHEESVQLESGHLLHDLTATENDHIVGDQDSGGLLKGGERSDTLSEFELAGGVSHNHLIGLIKERP